MGVWRLVYDKSVLMRLWAAGKTHVEIAAALGCSAGYVEKLRIRHGLPRRPRCHHGPQDDDPTPEQIAERAAECRARRPGLPEPKGERVSIPKYSWDGYRFHGLS
jgi:hypothetical protein